MNKNYFYCDGWFAAKRKAVDLMPESQAAVAHESKKTYTVLVGSETKPSCVLDIVDKFVGVDFLDSHLRKYISHHFKEIEQGKLFLQVAVERKFDGDTDTVVSGREFTFKPEGVVHVRDVTYFPERKAEEYDVHVDVDGCYTNYPEFGEYDDLIVIERNIQPA